MFALFYCLLFVYVNCLRLEQTVIFSRHNLRVPLSDNLADYTTKHIPKWPKDAGLLTEKGALLESHMADYLTTWMTDNGLLEKTCPNEENVVIYSNNAQRTIATAQAYAKSAFPGCEVDVKYKKDVTKRDYNFSPVIRNTTEQFKTRVIEEIESLLQKTQLKESYEELNKIIDLKSSKICINKGFCDLANDKNVIIYETNKELRLQGPVQIGNAVVDNFIMSYYEGRPLEEVAWGQITSPNKWDLLTKISKADQEIRFNVPSSVDDVAGPILKYIKALFYNQKVKFALLVGHDANLNCIINSLGFVAFELKEQYEPYPIGGKLVFQKWKDASGKEYLKVEYVYMSWDQIRDGAVISTQNPPLRKVLEIKGCAIDENGFCPWTDFLKVMEKYE